MSDKVLYTCEVCGKKELLTPEEGRVGGWDHPPHIGRLGMISPRTCRNCPVEETAWWAILVEGKTYDELSERHKETLSRIIAEPASIFSMEGLKDEMAGN